MPAAPAARIAPFLPRRSSLAACPEVIFPLSISPNGMASPPLHASFAPPAAPGYAARVQATPRRRPCRCRTLWCRQAWPRRARRADPRGRRRHPFPPRRPRSPSVRIRRPLRRQGAATASTSPLSQRARIRAAEAPAGNRSDLFQHEKHHQSHLGRDHDGLAALDGEQDNRRLHCVACVRRGPAFGPARNSLPDLMAALGLHRPGLHGVDPGRPSPPGRVARGRRGACRLASIAPASLPPPRTTPQSWLQLGDRVRRALQLRQAGAARAEGPQAAAAAYGARERGPRRSRARTGAAGGPRSGTASAPPHWPCARCPDAAPPRRPESQPADGKTGASGTPLPPAPGPWAAAVRTLAR